jgi:hypothetical protein
MIMVRADAQMEAGGMPTGAMLAAMAHYHEELAQAGILLDEAIEWARRMPFEGDPGRDAVIEVQHLFGLDDFGPGESVERFRALGVGGEG